MTHDGAMRWVLPLLLAGCATAGSQSAYRVDGDEIRMPLAAEQADPARGRAILVSRDSNCILCHAAPETGERFFGVRAELPPAGAQDLLDLELFLAWRGQGLSVETPAVRR